MMAPFQYTDTTPTDCSLESDLSKLKNKSVVVTGGMLSLGMDHHYRLMDSNRQQWIGRCICEGLPRRRVSCAPSLDLFMLRF